MLHAAFPNMSRNTEMKETSWTRTAFDCTGTNPAGPRRLAGVWAPIPVVLHLAELYHIQDVTLLLLNATPPDVDRLPRHDPSTFARVASLGHSLPSLSELKTFPVNQSHAESHNSPSAAITHITIPATVDDASADLALLELA